MIVSTVHCPVKPEAMQYHLLGSGIAEVWIRKNIRQTTVEAETGAEKSLEYTYEEVYFQTTATQEEIEANQDSYWETGQGWEPEVPLTPEQKIEKLQLELNQANADLAQAKTDNDMAIAELTMVMAAMMGGA